MFNTNQSTLRKAITRACGAFALLAAFVAQANADPVIYTDEVDFANAAIAESTILSFESFESLGEASGAS